MFSAAAASAGRPSHHDTSAAVHRAAPLSPTDAPRLAISEEEMHEPIQLEDGQPLSLTCDIEGNPEPTVVWFNHSEPFISETDTVQVSEA